MSYISSFGGGVPLTWNAILELIESDPDYPFDRRTYDASRVRKALAWDAAPTWHAARSPVNKHSRFSSLPFNRETIGELFDNVRATDLRLAQKTIDNARSACNRVANYYQLTHGFSRTPLSDECRQLLALVESKWDRIPLMSGMRYLSYVHQSPWRMDDFIASNFEEALTALRPKWAKRDMREFTRAWNKCSAAIPEWPKFVLARRVRPPRPTIDWADYPEVRTAIDDYLACGCRVPVEEGEELDGNDDLDLDLDDLLLPLAPRTIRGHLEHLRRVVWALRDEHPKTLRDLCAPRRYQQAMRALADQVGGVNRTTMNRANVLLRLARHPGILTKAEIKLVLTVHARYVKKYAEYKKECEDRDQKTLDQLDDPSVMAAFLALPTLTLNRVLAQRNRKTVACAYAIQRALILELWLCAPWRINKFVNIELDQIVTIRLDAVDRAILQAPKRQATNKRSPEHFLNKSTMELLRLYVEEYRPLILAANKSPLDLPHLFPGRNGRAKCVTGLRDQMTRFVRQNTSLKHWHPHVMRKIAPKIALDQDPGALDVARRTGGWTDEKMLRGIYGQRVHRASQARYLDLLESQRLTSVRSVNRRTRKGGR